MKDNRNKQIQQIIQLEVKAYVIVHTNLAHNIIVVYCLL